MPSYLYTAEAVDGRNKTKSGEITADNPLKAHAKVEALFGYPVKVSLNTPFTPGPTVAIVDAYNDPLLESDFRKRSGDND